MESKGPLKCLQESATVPTLSHMYPLQPNPPCFPKIHSSIIHLRPGHQCGSSLQISNQNIVCNFISPKRAECPVFPDNLRKD
jgi:hypothetical protein